MKSLLASLSLSLLAVAPVAAVSADAVPDARALVEKAQKGGTPKTLQSSMIMELKDKGGRTQSRALEIRKIEDEKQLVWFVTPADLRGTAFLRLGGASDRKMWLYLPAFKRVERISGSKENESFLGSDFTYADMADRDLNQFNHKYVGTEELKGVKLHKVDSTLKEKDDDAPYTRVVSYISPEGRLLREDLYDFSGDLVKRKTHENFTKVEGYDIPSAVVMVDLLRDHQTRIEMKNIKVDESISESIFSTQHMQRMRP
jgi:hypothetical protein